MSWPFGLALLLAWTAASAAAPPGAPGACVAQSGPQALTVVELYTSEGCSSCPPADRWLSALRGRPGVLALAFHVDYWDSLGWPDRFAAPAHTQRQREQMRPSGARFVYTPQVIAQGLDWRWRERPLPPARPSLVRVSLTRQGDREHAQAQVQSLPGGPTQLAAYWALLQDDQATQVARGENAGAHLRHDHVVRAYQPVATWTARSDRTHALAAPWPLVDRRQRLALVVTDADSHRPLDAVVLDCP